MTSPTRIDRSTAPGALLARLKAEAAHPALAELDELATIRRTDRGATLRGRKRGRDWSVVVKLYSDEDGLERAQRLYELHRYAYERLRSEPGLGVPEPIARFAGLPGYAMRLVPGRAASSVVKWTLLGRTRTREELLARAARWLSAYHRGAERSRVSPRYLLRELGERAEARGTGALGPAAAGFEAALEVLREGADRLGGFEFPKAVTHGDFNLHNIIVDGENTWSIDFAGAAGSVRPVSFDVACCLFYLEFRDGWSGEDRAGMPGGFDRRALEIFARHYPDLPWDSAEAAWLFLHHQLRQWTSFERLNMERHSARMAEVCRAAAAALEERMA